MEYRDNGVFRSPDDFFRHRRDLGRSSTRNLLGKVEDIKIDGVIVGHITQCAWTVNMRATRAHCRDLWLRYWLNGVFIMRILCQWGGLIIGQEWNAEGLLFSKWKKFLPGHVDIVYCRLIMGRASMDGRAKGAVCSRDSDGELFSNARNNDHGSNFEMGKRLAYFSLS